MKLSKIEIKNFRSIEDMTITTSPACQGFVGINESGKTNILTAISLLSSNVILDKNDVRIEGTEEDRGLESYIKYFFELSKSEMKAILNVLLASIYIESSLSKINFPNGEISVSNFFLPKNIGLYRCDIENEEKNALYYRLNENEIVPVPWLKKKFQEADDASITSPSGQTIPLSEYTFVETECISADDMFLFEDCTTNDLNVVFGRVLMEHVRNNIPNVIYWKYDSKHLLPNSIHLKCLKRIQAPVFR